MKESDQKLLAIREAAQYLGLTEATLRRWHNDNSFPATFVSPGKHRYYSMADLEKKTKGLFRLAYEWASSTESYEPESDFYCSTNDRFRTRHERLDEIIQTPLVSAAVGEIGNNSFDHNLGNWPDVNGVFFAYDMGKRIIVLADRGIGILATLQRVKPELQTHIEALEAAFTKIITGRAPEHRGNGLKFVLSAIRESHAGLLFQSGDAILEIKKGASDFSIQKNTESLRGCLATITF